MEKIGVIGAGSMGRGIAQVAATAGHEVIIFDTNTETLAQARDFILKMLNKLATKGKLTDQEAKAIFGRIYFVESFSSFSDCNLIIEAIIENLEIKQKVFKELETIVSADCILASNTSSLSIGSLAAACKNASRFIGIHFFNPAPLMKLVEVIPAIQTDQAIVASSRKLIESWGKAVVLAKDTPGFIVNKVARPFYSEALRIYEENDYSCADIDQALKQIGFRMGPFELMDYIGHDVNYKVTETVWKAFYYDPRYKPSLTQKALADAGYLGRKSGKGFYEYIDAKQVPQKSTLEADDQQYIQDRVLAMLINEAADTAFLKIASIEDIETAMTKGVNYPKGLFAWAEEIGPQKIVKRLDDLFDRFGDARYRCSPLLRDMS